MIYGLLERFLQRAVNVNEESVLRRAVREAVSVIVA